MRSVGRAACKMFYLSWNWFSMLFLLNLFKNLNFWTSYIKQIMKCLLIRAIGTNIFIRWKMKCTVQLGFVSLNGTYHLSPHENICTIPLINIHYLYTKHSPHLFDASKLIHRYYTSMGRPTADFCSKKTLLVNVWLNTLAHLCCYDHSIDRYMLK